MSTETTIRTRTRIGAFVVTLAGFLLLPATQLFAAPPVVKTVPWVATNPLIPHDTYAGKSVTLKGTSDVAGTVATPNIEYTWDYGDGTPVLNGRVMTTTPLATDRRPYLIDTTHTYAGAVGTVFTARLTVRNTTTGETANTAYYVQMQNKTLSVEVNVAIDEGLWYLHKTMNRTTVSGAEVGDWAVCPFGSCFATSTYYAVSALNTHAFLVNGHREDGSATNPYTETVARGLKRLFQFLTTAATVATKTNLRGTFNPDTNGNAYGVRVNQFDELYQGGSFMDAIVAAGTPDRLTTTGAVAAGANPGIIGRSYRSIVQDMSDYYLNCQYVGSSGTLALGGWRYSCNDFPDNSANQWGAIGMIPAQRVLGQPIPAAAKSANVDWLTYSQNATTGVFGYTSTGPIWGPYATTPSGMVQLVWNGLGRGNTMWNKAETYMRDNFGNAIGATTSPKGYYYGLFSFVKSMLLHDSNNDGIAEPISMLQSTTAGVNPIDWYSAQVAPNGADTTNGIARQLIGDQNVAGYWSGHNYSGEQYTLETGQAIIMLNRTIFEAGAPVAVISATPNPAVAFQLVTLSGAPSFHQDPTKIIDSWSWDLDNNGTFETTGLVVTKSFPAVGDYVVRLRVSDNATPEAFAETTTTIRVTTPPLAPTAEAGGPYSFCTNQMTWFLDGTGSNNPDTGQGEPGLPTDMIIAYDWDLNGDGTFSEASGASPNVTAYFSPLGVGSYLISLRVTDRTSISFPSSGLANLTDTDTAQVVVRGAADPVCACTSNVTARPKLNKAEIRWTPRAGVHHYNIYRGAVSGGPYVKVGETPGGGGFFLDPGLLSVGSTYYWVVREAAINNNETCQSNQASALVTGR